jgi:hypothetical protein
MGKKTKKGRERRKDTGIPSAFVESGTTMSHRDCQSFPRQTQYEITGSRNPCRRMETRLCFEQIGTPTTPFAQVVEKALSSPQPTSIHVSVRREGNQMLQMWELGDRITSNPNPRREKQ